METYTNVTAQLKGNMRNKTEEDLRELREQSGCQLPRILATVCLPQQGAWLWPGPLAEEGLPCGASRSPSGFSSWTHVNTSSFTKCHERVISVCSEWGSTGLFHL